MSWNDFLAALRRPIPVIAGLGVVAGMVLIVGAALKDPAGLFGATTAAWVQAVGTIGAIVGAAWIASRDVAYRRLQDQEQRTEKKAIAARTLSRAYEEALSLVESAERFLDTLLEYLRNDCAFEDLATTVPARVLIEERLALISAEMLASMEAWRAIARVRGVLLAIAKELEALPAELPFGAPPEDEAAACYDFADTLEVHRDLLTEAASELKAERDRLVSLT